MFSDRLLEIRRKSATPPRPNRGSKRSDSAIATSSVCGLMPRKVAENMPGLSNTSLFLLLVGWTRWSKPSQRNVLRLNTSHFPRPKSWLDSCDQEIAGSAGMHFEPTRGHFSRTSFRFFHAL